MVKASYALTTFNRDLTRLEDAFLAAIIPGNYGIFIKRLFLQNIPFIKFLIKLFNFKIYSFLKKKI